jgi:hypothetical protein
MVEISLNLAGKALTHELLAFSLHWRNIICILLSTIPLKVKQRMWM